MAIEKTNSLTELALGLRTQQNQIAQSDTAEVNLRRYMLTNNRMLLSYLYVEIGLVQTLIDQPVDDALAVFPEIKTEELDEGEIAQLYQYMQEQGWFEKFKQAEKWKRLYGGAGLFINVPQNPESEFSIERLNKNTQIDIYPVDRWELNYRASGAITIDNADLSKPISDVPYSLYGQNVHKSRVLQFKGKEAPSILKLQLFGWGMSEVERLIRSLNTFLKNQDTVFELMDEAKIDIYKIYGFAEALSQAGGTENITKQIQVANQIKNTLNALVMDSEDSYEQKTMTFAGLAEMHIQNRQMIASDLKMPVTKLWGVSSAGFNSGEDDIENYNSMLESEIRIKSRKNLIMLIKIACQINFGFVPEDIDLIYPPLRILSAEQIENIKTAQLDRMLNAFDRQLISEEQFIEFSNKANLFPMDL